jgi:hypothetical protein
VKSSGVFPDDWQATAWASTVPYLEKEDEFPSGTALSLPPAGIILYVRLDSQIAEPRPVEQQPPYQLSEARVDHGWEGQPAPNVEQRVIFTHVGDQYAVAIYALFGTQDPSPDTMRHAQEMLDSLTLPPWPPD